MVHLIWPFAKVSRGKTMRSLSEHPTMKLKPRLTGGKGQLFARMFRLFKHFRDSSEGDVQCVRPIQGCENVCLYLVCTKVPKLAKHNVLQNQASIWVRSHCEIKKKTNNCLAMHLRSCYCSAVFILYSLQWYCPNTQNRVNNELIRRIKWIPQWILDGKGKSVGRKERKGSFCRSRRLGQCISSDWETNPVLALDNSRGNSLVSQATKGFWLRYVYEHWHCTNVVCGTYCYTGRSDKQCADRRI